MTNFYRAEQLTEQTTTSSSFIDVSGASVTFTPDSTSQIWLIFVTGEMWSNSTSEVAAEAQLLINGTTHDLWGHQNSDASTPNGAGFFIFERITGTIASQTVKVQFRAATGTTTLDNIRVVAALLPDSADFQWYESDSITSTTGSNVQVGQMRWTVDTSGDYFIFGKMSHHEYPNGSTSQAWIEDLGELLHPDAPSGTHHSNARDAWNPMTAMWKVNLPAAVQTFNLRFTSSGVGAAASEHRYRKLMAFRADAWDQANYSESLGQSTTTSTSFQTKNSLAVAAPPESRDYLILQCARISGTNSSTGQKSGELRTGGTTTVRTDHHINRDGSSSQGYHHTIGHVDASNVSGAVTYYNGFLSPDAITVQCAESTIVVLRYPSAESGALYNSIFFGMVA